MNQTTDTAVIENFWQIADITKMTESYKIDQDLLRLRTTSLEELKRIFIQYRFFTLYYIEDLALLTAKLPFGALKSTLAEFLNEELGNGNERHAHPRLYDDFLYSLGITTEEIEQSNQECIQVLKTVQDSLREKTWDYGVGLRGMGGECLCQIYLSSMYEHFIQNPEIQALKPKLAWTFWNIHIGDVDIEHRERTRAAISQLIRDQPETITNLQAGYLQSKEAWDVFWKNIFKSGFYGN